MSKLVLSKGPVHFASGWRWLVWDNATHDYVDGMEFESKEEALRAISAANSKKVRP